MFGERDAAQAEVLIQALCDLRDKMITQMRWLEKHNSQLNAAALRRDINRIQSVQQPSAIATASLEPNG